MIEYQEMINNIRVKNCFQIQISSEFLETNFQLIKQCLKNVYAIKKDLAKQQKANKYVRQKVQLLLSNLDQNKLKAENVEKRLENLQNKNNFDDLNKRLSNLQQKSDKRNNNQLMQDIIKKLKEKQQFVEMKVYKENEIIINKQIQKLKEQMKFVKEKNVINQGNIQKNRIGNKNECQKLSQQLKDSNLKLKNISNQMTKITQSVNDNNNLLHEINFKDFINIDQKLKKIQQEFNANLHQIQKKHKKVVTHKQLQQNQKNIINKINQYLVQHLYPYYPSKQQTKNAFIFLQNKINILSNLQLDPQQQADSLFATKNWMCAACSTNLGKYQGKLNKYKPWAVFPCRQLSPQKMGGYGYLSYVQKVASQKNITVDDSCLERLNQTGISLKKSPNAKSVKTNFMVNFGQNSQQPSDLLSEYFKINEQQQQLTKSKQEDYMRRTMTKNTGRTQKTFRVKKQKYESQNDLKSEIKKQI